MGVQYWLYKSEPGKWSWDDQVRVGVTHWDGVRNYQAAANLKAMRVGDLGFFYHSVDEKRIVGVVEVVREYYPDPSDESARFGMVDLRAVAPVASPMTLAEIKADAALADMPLVRQSRLSVCPITEAQWQLMCARMGYGA
jgi:predicted RNA-binding protein with PUA-like domain